MLWSNYIFFYFFLHDGSKWPSTLIQSNSLLTAIPDHQKDKISSTREKVKFYNNEYNTKVTLLNDTPSLLRIILQYFNQKQKKKEQENRNLCIINLALLHIIYTVCPTNKDFDC